MNSENVSACHVFLHWIMEVTPLMRLGSVMTRHAGLLPVIPDPVKEGAEAAPGEGDPGPQPLARPALSRGSDKHVATLIQVPEQRPPEQWRVTSERLGTLTQRCGRRWTGQSRSRGSQGAQRPREQGSPTLSSRLAENISCVMSRLLSPESVPCLPLLSLPSLKSPVMAVTRSG